MKLKSRMILLGLSVFILLYSPIIVAVFPLASIYDNPFFRILEFLIGILLASMLNELQENRWIKKYLLNAAVLIIGNAGMFVCVTIAVRLNICENNYMMYSWICLPVFMISLLILASMKWKQNRIVIYFSNITYGIYLAQFILIPVMNKIMAFTGITNNLFKIIVSLILCIVIAVFIHEGVEKPVKKVLTKRFL